MQHVQKERVIGKVCLSKYFIYKIISFEGGWFRQNTTVVGSYLLV
jgi:hypothetical protein